jgi:hypothetical protein
MKGFNEMAADEVEKMDRALDHLAEISGEMLTYTEHLEDLMDRLTDENARLIQIIDWLKSDQSRSDNIQESCRDKEAADRIGGNFWSNF